MSTPPYFSNFISNFTDLSNIDIITSASDNIALLPAPLSYNGQYFCVGNLLIQFNTSTIQNQNSSANYTLNFPISYDTTPYTILLTGTNDDNNTIVDVTLKTFTSSDFTFRIGTNNGWINFLAIGPRPSSLYTA